MIVSSCFLVFTNSDVGSLWQLACRALLAPTMMVVDVTAITAIIFKVKVVQLLRKRSTPCVEVSIEEKHEETADRPRTDWKKPDAPIVHFATEVVFETPELEKMSHHKLCLQLQPSQEQQDHDLVALGLLFLLLKARLKIVLACFLLLVQWNDDERV